MLIAFGVIIMVLGTLGFFYNMKVGIAMLGIGGLTVSLAAAAIYYMGWFAVVGLVIAGTGMVCLFGHLGWALYRGRVFAKATEEHTELIETMKQDLPANTNKEYFGDRIKPGLVQNLQSVSTQRLVDQIRRRKLKPKIENTIFHPNLQDVVIKDGIIYQRVASPSTNKSESKDS